MRRVKVVLITLTTSKLKPKFVRASKRALVGLSSLGFNLHLDFLQIADT